VCYSSNSFGSEIGQTLLGVGTGGQSVWSICGGVNSLGFENRIKTL